jgi:pyridoxine kinase
MPGKTVAAISSLVMRGAVGLRAIQFALERRGATVWAVPTVVMPWHPGLGRSTRTAMADLPAQLDELATRAGEVDAVITGYFASAEQVEAAARFIDAVRRARPEAPILVDPVTGDERGRYVPDAVADAIRDALLSRADVATPNANELADFAGDGGAIAAARRLGPPAVVVTSAGAGEGRTGAMLVDGSGAVAAEHRIVENAPRGTGDLFGAVFLSARLSGADDRAALREAAAATLAVIEASGPDALALSAAQEVLAAPPLAAVAMRDVRETAP